MIWAMDRPLPDSTPPIIRQGTQIIPPAHTAAMESQLCRCSGLTSNPVCLLDIPYPLLIRQKSAPPRSFDQQNGITIQNSSPFVIMLRAKDSVRLLSFWTKDAAQVRLEGPGPAGLWRTRRSRTASAAGKRAISRERPLSSDAGK